VRLTRAGNSLKGFRSTDGATWTQVGESVQSGLPATLLFGLAVTSHNNGVLGTATFDNVSLVPTVPQPPTWTAQDIGAVGLAGSTSGTGTLTVKGAGADIYNAADAFHYYHRSLNADGEIRARIVSLGNTHQWAKAGVMIRETTAAGSRHVYMGTTPANGLEFVRREATGGTTTPVGIAGGAPRWVRLTRVGNVFTAYQSTDGSAWTQTGTVTLALAADVRVGLAVCSHDVNVLNTATFDNVSVTD
jgi:regulation of enolase protein 1 (concanavalin A-like superfamily)